MDPLLQVLASLTLGGLLVIYFGTIFGVRG